MLSKFIYTAKERWKAKTPVFFRNIVKFGTAVSGLAIAIHTALVMAGAMEPQWWVTSYPYVVGVPAGMAFVSKFARQYPGQPPPPPGPPGPPPPYDNDINNNNSNNSIENENRQKTA